MAIELTESQWKVAERIAIQAGDLVECTGDGALLHRRVVFARTGSGSASVAHYRRNLMESAKAFPDEAAADAMLKECVRWFAENSGVTECPSCLAMHNIPQ